MRRPQFWSLVHGYPFGEPNVVKAKIGGKVNVGWIRNTCAIRMSSSLNHAGVKIPRKYPGLLTAKGGNGNYYALRIKEISKYYRKVFGPPDVFMDGKVGSINSDQIINKQGIVALHVSFSDATGHTTLWYKEVCVDESNYFNRAYRMEFWSMP